MNRSVVVLAAFIAAALPGQAAASGEYTFVVPIDIKNLHEGINVKVQCWVWGKKLSGQVGWVSKAGYPSIVHVDPITGNATTTEVRVQVPVSASFADPRDITRYECWLVTQDSHDPPRGLSNNVNVRNAAGVYETVQISDTTKPARKMVGGNIANP